MRKGRLFTGALVACGLALTTACKKQKIDVPQVNDPVFRVVGTLDGEPINLVAGDDNAFMHTMTHKENGVDVYSGNLSDGSLGIELNIYDGLIDKPNRKLISSLPDNLDFARSTSSTLALLDKDQFPNAMLIDHVNWHINGELVGVNTYEISEPGKYDVCAYVTFLDGSSNHLCGELILGYAKNANCQIKHYLNNNGVLSAWAEETNVPIEKVQWFQDEELLSVSQEFSTNIGQGYYRLRAETHFQNGVVRSKGMLVDGSLSGKYIGDLTMFETANTSLSMRDFNVVVKVHEDTMTLSSEYVNNEDGTMTINRIDSYGLDANGNPTIKIAATVNAKVGNEQGLYQKDVSFETVFAVALPKE